MGEITYQDLVSESLELIPYVALFLHQQGALVQLVFLARFRHTFLYGLFHPTRQIFQLCGVGKLTSPPVNTHFQTLIF